jgi:hypothetical protein
LVPERHFPPPWSVEEMEAWFIVRDHDGEALAYVYFEDAGALLPTCSPATRRTGSKANIAKIPQYRRGGATS